MKPMWREGLLVKPQHLQLMEEYQESLLERRLRALMPDSWGLCDLEIDEGELARGLLQLKSCTAVMPDGLMVSIGPGEVQATAVAMTPDRTASGEQRCDVYLAVPSEATRGTAAYVDGAGGRFVRVKTSVADDFGVARPTEVEGLRPNARLLLGSDDRQDYVTIKIAEIVPAEDGGHKRSEGYFPPCVRIGACRALMSRLADLINALLARHKKLSERYRGRAAALVEFGPADLSTFWLLQTINAATPRLMHHASAGKAHPEVLYLALASLAGQLSSYAPSGEDDLADLPRYDHLDLAATFLPLFGRLKEQLGVAVAKRYVEITLEQGQPGLFVGNVEDRQLLRRTQLYLVASGELDARTLREDVARHVKIAAMSQIADIVQAAVAGVEVELEMAPPSAIPVRPGEVYLRMKQAGPYWDEMLAASSIAIYQPVQPSVVQLRLLAVEG